MSRSISILHLSPDAKEPGGIQVHDWSYAAANALGWQTDNNHDRGVKVGGCGMDMGFHLVYELSELLHGNGYALKHRWL